MFNQHHFDIATKASEESDSLSRCYAWNRSSSNGIANGHPANDRGGKASGNTKYRPRHKIFVKCLPRDLMTAYVGPNEPIHWQRWSEEAGAVIRDYF